MKLFVSMVLLSAGIALGETDYPLPEEAKPRADVPKGEVLKFTLEQSNVFPGTVRDYSIYIPGQYDPAKPACVHINQDGIQNHAPVVFDNLIAKGDMPITIGVFVAPGRVKAPHTNALDRFNRSFEYDGLGDAYARFLLSELLPDVEKRTASDGRAIRLSTNGSDRAIGGSSSGAICAFTAAWERPDAFTRVFSSIGTYVGLRGGNDYPTLVRKYEPKPLRIFLQDGSNDLNIYAGDWWMANQELERALTFSGYEHTHVWGDGGHNGKHAAAVFPDAVRFLWKGWPEAPKAGASQNRMLQEILLPSEDWQLVAAGFKFTEGPAANAKGELFFVDAGNSKSLRLEADGKVTEFVADTQRTGGQAFGPDGRLFLAAGGGMKIIAANADGKLSDITDGIKGNDLVVRHDGGIYVTEPGADGARGGSTIWYVSPSGEKRAVDTGLKFSNGITLSPDQTLLYVADMKSHWVYSYQVQTDGSLKHKQKYYHLHVPDTADDSGADGMKCDRDGRLYVATRMGIQVCDQAGRVNCILPLPNGKVSNLCFAGEKFDTLYATSGDRVFKRKMKVQGVLPYAEPLKPAAPKL